MANKYYAVRVGREPGIYRTWAECQEQVKGFAGAMFKSFPTLETASAYLEEAPVASSTAAGTGWEIFVDGSYDIRQHQYSWAFAAYQNGELRRTESGVGDNPAASDMRNVAGELAAAMRAVNWAKQQNLRPITIHHDYSGIAAWATGAWQAKNPFTSAYAAFMVSCRDWVYFAKVKGHSGVAGNELVDKLAGEALRVGSEKAETMNETGQE